MEVVLKKIIHYIARDGQSVFQGWFRKLKDGTAKFKITRRLTQAKSGNLGIQSRLVKVFMRCVLIIKWGQVDNAD